MFSWRLPHIPVRRRPRSGIDHVLIPPSRLLFNGRRAAGDPVASAAEESDGAIVLSGDSGCSAIVTLHLTATEFPNRDNYANDIGRKDSQDRSADGLLGGDADAAAAAALSGVPLPSSAGISARDAEHGGAAGAAGISGSSSPRHVDTRGQHVCDVDAVADDVVKDTEDDHNRSDAGIGESTDKRGSRDYSCRGCGCDVCDCAADLKDNDGEVEEIAISDEDFGYYYYSDNDLSPDELSGFVATTGDDFFAHEDQTAKEQVSPNPAAPTQQHPPRPPATENTVSTVVAAAAALTHRRPQSRCPSPAEKTGKLKNSSSTAVAAAAEPTTSRERGTVSPSCSYYGRAAAGRLSLTQGASAPAKPPRYDDNIETMPASSSRTAGLMRSQSQPVGGVRPAAFGLPRGGLGGAILDAPTPVERTAEKVQDGGEEKSRGGGRGATGEVEAAGEEGVGTPEVERMPAYEEMTVQELAGMVSVYGLKKKSKR